MKIANIKTYKNGKKTVNFHKIGIYELIKKKLGFRFVKIDGIEYYLENKNGIYLESSFLKLKDKFEKYIKSEFNNIEFNGEIECCDFFDAYYHKRPLKDGKDVKKYFSDNFELSDEEMHLFKMYNDYKYRYEIERKEMKEFLRREKFVRTDCLFGDFFNKEGEVFYKKVKQNSFLLLYYRNWNMGKSQPIYELYKINAEKEEILFKKRGEEIESVSLNFNLSRDLEFYNSEK